MHFSLKSMMILVLVLVLLQLKAQEEHICDDLRSFGKHLFETENYQDMVRLNRACPFSSQNRPKPVFDTLQFLLGRSQLKLNNIDSAYYAFRKIDRRTPLYKKGIRLTFNRYLDRKDYTTPLSFLENGDLEVNQKPDIAYFSCGLYLLNNEQLRFDSLMNVVQVMEKDKRALLNQYRKQYASINMKSPWMAGLLSAAVPGLGKVYAGKPNQGLSSFLTVGIFALQSWEAYYRQGLTAPGLYLSGAFALGYYIGNIWGSALSVKIKNQEELYEVDQRLRDDLYFSL
ncbi:MAG: hypothetical protein ACOCPM_01080 [Bacteroidales bacterium]